MSSPDNVEVRITATSDGGGPNRRYVEIDALNWDANVAGATLNGTIQLYEAGTAKTPSQNFTISPSDGEERITLNFDGADLTDASGADLECRVWQTDSSPTEFIEIGAVDAVITNSVGSIGFNLQLGNSVDGMANVRLVSVGTSIAQYDSGTGLADVIPLKTEFGRWGIEKQANSYYDIKVYECFQDVIFDPTGAATNIGSINPVAYANIGSFNLVAKANWDNINGVA